MSDAVSRAGKVLAAADSIDCPDRLAVEAQHECIDELVERAHQPGGQTGQNCAPVAALDLDRVRARRARAARPWTIGSDLERAALVRPLA